MSTEIGKAILQQLGGNKFVVMTGANNFVATDQGLNFKLPGGGGFTKDGINYVEVVLTPADVYSIYFFRRRAGKLKEVARVHDVYNSDLQSVFTENTGLLTSLGRVA